MQRIILAGTLLLALSSPSMAGQIYKWVDANGTTHYGAQPPQDRPATNVNTLVAPPRPVAAPAAQAPAEGVVDAEQEAINAKVKAEVAAQAEQLAENCKIYRNNLAQMQNNPRVRIEVDGEVRRLTEEERQTRMAEAEKIIKENCQ